MDGWACVKYAVHFLTTSVLLQRVNSPGPRWDTKEPPGHADHNNRISRFLFFFFFVIVRKQVLKGNLWLVLNHWNWLWVHTISRLVPEQEITGLCIWSTVWSWLSCLLPEMTVTNVRHIQAASVWLGTSTSTFWALLAFVNGLLKKHDEHGSFLCLYIKKSRDS